MTRIIALLLYGLQPTPDQVDRWEFSLAQEQWVAAAIPGAVNPMVEALGAPCYQDRARAYWRLMGLGPQAIPLLARGVAHHDPEVRQQSARLVDRLFRCRMCGGNGETLDRRGDKLVDCRWCGFSGDLRYRLDTTAAGVVYTHRTQRGPVSWGESSGEVWQMALVVERVKWMMRHDRIRFLMHAITSGASGWCS